MKKLSGWCRFIAWQVLVFGLISLWRLAGIDSALVLLQVVAWLFGVTGMLAACLWPNRGLCQRSVARMAASAASTQVIALLLLLNLQVTAALLYMLGAAGREIYRRRCAAARSVSPQGAAPAVARGAQP